MKMNEMNRNTKINKAQGGFTLIELLVVIAIIGILAAIAIPQYQNYVARAQATEAVSMLSAAKTPITEFVSRNGEFPTAAELVELGVIDAADGSLQKADSVATILPNGAAVNGGVVTAQLQATMSATGLNAALTNQVIALSYNSGTGSWVCGTDIAAANYELVSQECRRTLAEADTAAAPAP